MQQNDDMRKISAGVGLVAAPTLVAGIYGMNFDHMPELGWTLGYPMALLLMAASSLSAYRVLQALRLAVSRSGVERAGRDSRTRTSEPRPTR